MKAVVALAASALCGCSVAADADAPRLSSLTYDGQAPDSTLVLLMSVDFADADGDLGVEGGVLETFINGKATSAGPIPLFTIFVQNELPLDATEGTLAFTLELSFPEAEADRPDDGSSFRLGTRAQDAAGHVSTTEQVALRLTYE
jgi:hypothetical protein